ncbi:MAG: DNA-processing protein DprA [Thermoleophilaceae bacterium]
MSGACDACLRRGYLVGLLAGRIAGLLGRRGGRRPPALLALDDAELAMAVGGPGTAEALDFLGRFEPGRARADLRHTGVGATCRHSDRYPAMLRDLADPPATIFSRGRLELLAAVDEEPAVTIVGTRDASPYGLDVAHELARGLAVAGITTISGMALGIDGAAHRGALGARGGTIAVLACGPDVAYPRSHRDIHRQICESGLVVSELPPGQRAYRWSFPARNRLMAALARLTVVVEAGESSGTLITANFAQDLGRTVAAVPGRVTARVAAGSNRLLREGAPVIRDAGDALDEVFGVGARPELTLALEAPELEPLERRLLDAVEAGLDMDALCAFADVAVGEARAALAGLESRGLVRRAGLSGWERTAAAR